MDVNLSFHNIYYIKSCCTPTNTTMSYVSYISKINTYIHTYKWHVRIAREILDRRKLSRLWKGRDASNFSPVGPRHLRGTSKLFVCLKIEWNINMPSGVNIPSLYIKFTRPSVFQVWGKNCKKGYKWSLGIVIIVPANITGIYLVPGALLNL